MRSFPYFEAHVCSCGMTKFEARPCTNSPLCPMQVMVSIVVLTTITTRFCRDCYGMGLILTLHFLLHATTTRGFLQTQALGKSLFTVHSATLKSTSLRPHLWKYSLLLFYSFPPFVPHGTKALDSRGVLGCLASHYCRGSKQ